MSDQPIVPITSSLGTTDAHAIQVTGPNADEIVVTDDLELLLAALPPRIREQLPPTSSDDLLEIILDLGRLPEARYVGRAVDLSEQVVSEEDLAYVTARIGTFGDDNRAGIGGTLHRISALRNRRGQVVGLTCRVGRAVRGTVALIRDVVEQGRSILILGRPGVGKTTLLREAARVLADELDKRVVVVDTSNEIAGDGDIPHPGIGRARRMQVARTAAQHQVMIEAVENHMPEVVVIDEIGTELEAQAARTIAERGVQLVGTAHGRTLDNLLVNPTLSDLVGGIGSVTLGDEEARRRGTQKTVLERKAPPTFDVLVEQESWRRVIIHHDVAAAVDDILRGHPPTAELRERDEAGNVTSKLIVVEPIEAPAWGGGGLRPGDRASTGHPYDYGDFGYFDGEGRGNGSFSGAVPRRRGAAIHGPAAGRYGYAHADNETRSLPPYAQSEDPGALAHEEIVDSDEQATGTTGAPLPLPPLRRGEGVQRQRGPRTIRIYPFGISRDRLEQSARQLRVPVEISHDLPHADAVIALKNFYQRQPERLRPAESDRKPIYVLKNNTIEQMAEALAHLFELGRPGQAVAGANQHDAARDALLEAEDAINRVLTAGGGQVELGPQNSYVRRMQHQLAERYNLTSRSRGKEPNRRVRIVSR
ncbi:MAG TPA: R3H domain-containing nucleic acid-binding protein [Ktedonobacterales bacterium]|nr:R3H domain-containing nucleic acid-binding protein [Ktedonobacterales bacterium]